MAALDALESAVERRRDADRDENELASRIQALGADRSRLADELDGSLVKARRLERANREIAERLDAAIGTIRAVLDEGAGLDEGAAFDEAEEDCMSHVNVTINGRLYRMACEEGQESQLIDLAESFETRIEGLRGKFGEIGDARLTVMAALTVCDELIDATERVRSLEQELGALRDIRAVASDRARATQTAVAQGAERRRRPHREDHANPEPDYRRRRGDRIAQRLRSCSRQPSM